MTDRKYMSSLDNYEIIPAVVSNIRHRNECIPYYGAFYSTDFDNYSLAGAYLPIIAAPMASVINENNYMDFDANGIMTVIPRTIPLSTRLEIMKKSVFVAVGLDEFKMIINDYTSLPEDTMICLDVANGHMKEVLDLSREAKTKFGDNLVLMTGNIANPDTYLWYANAGIDFVRCSIGSGNVCSTSYLSGIHMSMDKLIKRTYKNKQYVEEHYTQFKSVPKIVADGGFQSIRQIIIALALGADYVMLGQMFASCEEACGEIVWYKEWNPRMMQASEEKKPYRVYYGMSTERAQKEMGHSKVKPAEGVEKLVPIKYTIKDWTKEFVRIISSTMSYCNTIMLEDFVGKVQVEKASDGEYMSYEKSKYI